MGLHIIPFDLNISVEQTPELLVGQVEREVLDLVSEEFQCGGMTHRRKLLPSVPSRTCVLSGVFQSYIDPHLCLRENGLVPQEKEGNAVGPGGSTTGWGSSVLLKGSLRGFRGLPSDSFFLLSWTPVEDCTHK